MMTASKQSALHAYDALTRRWAPIPSGTLSKIPTSPSPQPLIQQAQKELTLTSWNIDAFSPWPTVRASRILGSILERSKTPDIVFFQEVKHDVYDSLLRDERVRTGFLATDVEDRTAFQGVPFATVILLSRKCFTSGNLEEVAGREESNEEAKMLLGPATRLKLPSKYGRDGLCVDFHHATGRAIRFVNVHLDSLADTLHNRAQQLEILSHKLLEDGCERGLIAGDFNAISPADHKLVGENGLRDQWTALHGKESNGYTWGVDRQEADGLPPGRLDKIAMMGLEATEIDVLHPGTIAVPRPGEPDDEIPWSDHSGLTCSFNI